MWGIICPRCNREAMPWNAKPSVGDYSSIRWDYWCPNCDFEWDKEKEVEVVKPEHKKWGESWG